MLTLKWTDKRTAWFEDSTTDSKHWRNSCVDCSVMPKNSIGYKKYLTENAVKQLLKTNNVYFVCRYMPNEEKGSLGD